ncbi:hypothetical protein ACFVZH_07640 [Streptomyces sp. NPDC059534]|uniref:hypothetical protein n=1 Tax=Streptomyces sp. NPDC059534 TaxID=3346859 RepID=UPI0036B4BADF
MPTRIRFLAAFAATALAASLAACGSAAEGDRTAASSPAQAGGSGGSGSSGSSGDAGTKDCSGKKIEGSVKDDGVGGTVALDPCATPATEKATLTTAWVTVSDIPRDTAHPLNINPVSCRNDSADSCTQVKVADNFALCNTAKPGCHPARNEQLTVVCLADDVDRSQGDTTRWYGILLDRRLLALGTDHDARFVQHLTDKGDKPVGYVPTTAVTPVKGGLPACDGTVLNSRGSLDIARAGGGAIR